MKKKVLIVVMALLLSSCGSVAVSSEGESSESQASSSSSESISSISTSEQSYEESSEDDTLYNPGKGLLIHTESQEKYLKGSPYVISRYATGVEELCQPDCIRLDYVDCSFPSESTIKVCVSENSDLSDGYVYETDSIESYDLYNCKLGTQYYWQASATKDDITYTSPINTFTTQDGIIRNIKAGNLSNMRDLGYYKGLDGKRIQQGLIYRCASFTFAGTLSSEGKDVVVNELGIKTDLDLAECGKVLTDLSYVSAPMYWDDPDLGGKTIIDADGNLASIKKCFETFADPSSYPLAFHCAHGRDRTGGIAFLLESLLGVSTKQMVYDYLFTAFSNNNNVGDATLIDTYSDIVNAYSGETQAERTEDFLEKAVGVSSENIQSIKKILLA